MVAFFIIEKSINSVNMELFIITVFCRLNGINYCQKDSNAEMKLLTVYV